MSVSGGPVAAKAEASTTIVTSAAFFFQVACRVVCRPTRPFQVGRAARTKLNRWCCKEQSCKQVTGGLSCPLEMPNFPGPGTALAFAADVLMIDGFYVRVSEQAHTILSIYITTI